MVPGKCPCCGEKFEAGTEIVRIEGQYVHADECADEYAGEQEEEE